MASLPPYFGFKESFAIKEQAEIEALLDEISTTPGFLDIHQLARGNAFQLALIIQGEVTLDDFWLAVSTDASMIASLGHPVNPEAPTLREQRVIDGMYEKFFALWPARKRKLLEAVLQYVGEDKYNTKSHYMALYKVHATSYTDLGSDFYELLADYYIAMAAEYVRHANKEYVFVGLIDNVPSKHGPVRVSCTDVNVGAEPLSMGWTTANKEGYFKIPFRVLEGIDADTYELAFTLAHPLLTGTSTFEGVFDVTEPNTPVLFSPTFTPLPSTSATVASTGLALPDAVEDYLDAGKGGVTARLDDIRRLGGSRNFPIKEDYDRNDPDLIELDALAALELLQEDLVKNQTLFTRGYKSVADVALDSRKNFIETTTDLFGDLGAGRIHYKARAVHMYGINMAAASLAPIPDHKNGGAQPTRVTATPCNCEDCRSAVSPIAYLADLIGFIASHITNNEEKVDVEFLEENFHHRIGGLQLQCGQLKKQVCQNRIASETLRHFQRPGGGNVPEGDNLAALQLAEKKYLTQAYELLLNKLGTSYEEVRSARGVTQEAVGRKLAERLDLPFMHAGYSTISKLFIDLSDPDNIREGQTLGGSTGLESLFGLLDSKRIPLTDPPMSAVEEWKKARLREVWAQQDGLGPAFPGESGSWNAIIDPDVVTIDDLRLPMTGLPGELSIPFVIWKARREWIDAEFAALDGSLVLVVGGPIAHPVERRRSVFKEERMVVAYGIERLLEPIETLFDFKPDDELVPITFTMVDQFVANGNTYYRVAEEPELDRYAGELYLGEDVHENSPVYVRSCAQMIKRLAEDLTTPYAEGVVPSGWSEDVIEEDIRPALDMDPEEQAATLAALALDLGSARRLLELYDKNESDPIARELEGGLTEDEWVEFKDILLMVLKRRACDVAWREEEEELELVLGPMDFMPSITPPKQGHFPLMGPRPFLDPDLVGTKDLPEITATTAHPVGVRTVHEIIADRRDELKADREALMAAPDINALLGLAFAEPDLEWTPADDSTNDYLRLFNGLSDPTQAEWVRFYVEQRLKLTEAELKTVVVYGVKVDDEEQVPAGEYESVLAILQRAHKFIVRYRGSWLTDEAAEPHWALRKALLPKWRATMEQRVEWLNALARNSEAPIIDPDLIGPSELKVPEPGVRAYDLWQERVEERDGWLADLSTGDGVLDDLADFNGLLRTHIVFAEPTIESLRDSAKAGMDIRPRLAQLNLTTVEFNQLMVFHDLLDATPPDVLRVEEKMVVRHILVRVKKRRHVMAYRTAESDVAPHPVITLSQDHFKLREPGVLTYPPDPAYPIQPWLASEVDLAAWRRKLSTRVEQERGVLDAWQEALFEVDEAMMVHLRDALVQANGNQEGSLIKNARFWGDRFLIDLENNCCFKTNRVAAAIESLQQLIWKTRTGDIIQHYPALVFDGDFDQAWEWMGSYANWRSAMFVFLYPENVLHPSLRAFSSQAFKDVVEATRNNKRFGPQDACATAHAYEAYLKDLNELEVACSQQARAWLGTDECGRAQFAEQKLTYIFAKAKGSKRLYVSVVDTREPSAVQQTECWNSIPIPDGVNYTIRGSHRYLNADLSIDHILLFVTNEWDSDKSKFYILRFALRTQQWDEEGPREFEVKTDELMDERGTTPGFDEFDPTIRALCVMKNMAVWQPPLVVVTIRDKNGVPWSFKRDFNGAIDGYGGEGIWNNWVTASRDSSSTNTPNASLIGPIIDCWSYHPPQGWHFENVVEFFLLGSTMKSSVVYDERIVRHRNQGQVHYQSFPFNGAKNTARLLVNRNSSGDQTTILSLGYFHELRAVYHGDEVFDHPNGEFYYTTGSSALGSREARFIAVNPDERFAADLQVSVLQEPGTGAVPARIRLVNTVVSGMDPGTLNWDNPLLELQPRRTHEVRITKAGTPQEQALRRNLALNHWAMNRGGNDKLHVPFAEATYFVPMQIALQLHANGHYQAALDWFRSVYDHTLPAMERKVSYFLRQEENLQLEATRMANWYADPLNPHAMASVRPHTYTRYTIRAIVSCLLDYADAEFTMDNSESVPRARELYEDALDLLKYLSIGHTCAINEVITSFPAWGVPSAWVLVFAEAIERLDPISGSPNFQEVINAIRDAIGGEGTWGDRLAAVNAIIDAALTTVPTPTLTDVLVGVTDALGMASQGGSVWVDTELAYTSLVNLTASAFDRTLELITGRTAEFLEGESLPFLRDDRASLPFDQGYVRENVDPTFEEIMHRQGADHPAEAIYVNDPFSAIYISGTALAFCVVPNPVVNALVLKAEVELFKIRNCMNIAGMVRELDPFAAPTDSTTGIQVIGAAGGTINVPAQRAGLPSAYRYRFLVERARQLVGMAQQVEAAFLSALEKLDAERYAALRAEQDVATSRASIKLQDLKVREAESGVKLAELQRTRAQAQKDGLTGMIGTGLTWSEMEMLRLFSQIADTTITSNWLGFAMDSAEFTQGALKGLESIAGGIAASAGIAAALGRTFTQNELAKLNRDLQAASLYAGYERRVQEWNFQLSLAAVDVNIGDQQIKLANDRVRIVGQEREIAVLQNDHAKATMDFLRNKFTNADLYEWMSGVLEDAYSWFLQEATAIALLAERQLIFERNIELPPFIRSDYWQADPNQLGGGLGGDGTTDRRGLTGSTRLLRDLTELDQAAFSTNSPKRQLSKTFSLSELAPEELIRLRADGLASFYTVHEHFDRDYPGHYLRLIKKVSVTVIALTPPTKGIRATLSNGGTSRVFTGGVLFQEKTVKRYPEEIALSSGVGDSGVFSMQSETEFLNPFEASGVETLWEFRMDKAANPFDFNSIADVLITIDYEALSDRNRRTALANQFNTGLADGALAISFKNNLPDQWFDLHNTLQSATPYAVTFNIDPRDLAPHIAEATVSGISLFVLMKGQATFMGLLEVGLKDHGVKEVQPQEGVASAGMFAATSMIGAPVAGQWSFAVPGASTPARTHFDNDEVEDVYLVIRYSGDGAKYTMP